MERSKTHLENLECKDASETDQRMNFRMAVWCFCVISATRLLQNTSYKSWREICALSLSLLSSAPHKRCGGHCNSAPEAMHLFLIAFLLLLVRRLLLEAMHLLLVANIAPFVVTSASLVVTSALLVVSRS